MSNEKSPEGNVHEYDGIIELDNELPRWWLMTFAVCILFAAVYWIHYHTFGTGALPTAEYEQYQIEKAAEEAAKLLEAGEITEDLLVSMSKNPAAVAQGKAVFDSQCVTCHAAGGRGAVGPNLTDSFALHGSAGMDIYKIVKDGYLPKQMPAWGPQLGELKVRSLSTYVLSIRGTNVSGGKEPQGEKF